VKSWQGQGAYGAVYRAVRRGWRRSGYLRLFHYPDSYYPPSPADDLYALGVTAYRLAMGQYPPPWEARRDEQGVWRVTSPDFGPVLESNPWVEPRLREVIVRLLSEVPEARGTAGQVAETLEAAANESVPWSPVEAQPAAEVPPPDVPAPESGSKRPRRASPPMQESAWELWLALAAAGAVAVLLAALVWHSQPVSVPPGPVFVNASRALDSLQPRMNAPPASGTADSLVTGVDGSGG
jgi:serine/threonine protein kinase